MSEQNGGRPYIGPKAQAHVPPEDWEVIDYFMKSEGMSQSDAVRVVVAAGAEALREKIGAK